MKVERGREWEREAVLAAAPPARVEARLRCSTLRAVKMVVVVLSTTMVAIEKRLATA